jgi:hypothetical protein
MKRTKSIQIVITSLVVIAAVMLNSCTKPDQPAPPLINGTLYFHLITNVDTIEVQNTFGTIYSMRGGRKIAVTKAALYLSNIQLVKFGGAIYNVPGVYILQKQQNDTIGYPIANVPAANYIAMKFNVGLNPTQNALIPAASDSTLNTPAMWFGVTAQPSGYVFLNFQGLIDTTTAGNGSIFQMEPFSYKIGTNTNYKTVSMPMQNFIVVPGQPKYIDIVIDYNKLFSGIQLNNSSNLIMNTPAANATTLGMQLADSIPAMFRYAP